MACMKSCTLYFTSVSARYFVLSDTGTWYFWYRVIRTISIYDGGGEIVYNFNIKVIESLVGDILDECQNGCNAD